MPSLSDMDAVTEAFDKLDNDERPTFAAAEDRKWMWAHRKPGRAEYHERFRGPDEIVEWMETSLAADRGGYLSAEIRRPLIDQCWNIDSKVFASLGRGIERGAYDKHIGEWNSDDFFFANAYPLPARHKVRTVLDFGAGYGRQLNLWSQSVNDLRYLSVDVIRKPYLCQFAYFTFFDLPLHEYVLQPSTFAIGDAKGIYHVPAWRWDLIPDGSVDMILAIMVLPELHADTLYRTLDQFQRVLKPSGALYIRDHGLVSKSANTEDVAAALNTRNFVLEFRPYLKDQVDLRGIPRIWRKREAGIQVADENS